MMKSFALSGRCIPVNQGEPGLLLGKITEDAVFEGYTDAEATEKRLFVMRLSRTTLGLTRVI